MLARRSIAVMFTAILGGGCGLLSEEPEGAPAPRARQDAPPPGTVEAIEAKLAELEQRIKDARAAVRTAREAKDRAAVKIREWEREGRDLRQKLDAARRSGARAWTDIEKAIDRAMVEIETTLGASEQGETEG